MEYLLFWKTKVDIVAVLKAPSEGIHQWKSARAPRMRADFEDPPFSYFNTSTTSGSIRVSSLLSEMAAHTALHYR